MIKVENIDMWGFAHAIRGMRNPLNSWDKSDSVTDKKNPWCYKTPTMETDTCIGQNDLDLMERLFKAGTEHRKFARQIFVSMDITAPLYWWKEFDTYKVGTVANSCSTMHKIHAKRFTLDDFSHEHLEDEFSMVCLNNTISVMNMFRTNYLETKNKKYWWQMIQLLPSSYNQMRTVTLNYENVFSITKQRSGHKLDEWRDFVEILQSLPYVPEIMGE